MKLLIVGATEQAVAVAREAAARHRVHVTVGTMATRPDWIMVASTAERADAIERYGLPPHRISEVPQLATPAGPAFEFLHASIAKMAELGPYRRQTSSMGVSLASRVMPVWQEWAGWVAVDEARRRIAARAAFLGAKHGERSAGTVVFVVRDVSALRSVGGVMHHLSRQGHRVHVAMEGDWPETWDLSAWQDLCRGLSAGAAPPVEASGWRPLVRAVRDALDGWQSLFAHDRGTEEFRQALRLASPLTAAIARNRLLGSSLARGRVRRFLGSLERAIPPEPAIVLWLEDLKPETLVLAPFRSRETREIDYVRAARAVGVGTVYFPLHPDDLASAGLANEAPDVVAVWNQDQRRDAIETCAVPAANVHVTGALLATDLADPSADVTREEYCQRLGIDPSRRIVLYAAPDTADRVDVDRFEQWRRALQDSADPDVRDAALVLYVNAPDHAPGWRRAARRAGVLIDRATADPCRSALRLREGVTLADAIVAANARVAVEAAARGRPVLTCVLEEGSDDTDMARFARACPSSPDWPLASRSLAEHSRQLSMVLRSGMPAASLRQAAEFVGPRGPDVESTVTVLTRILGERGTRPIGPPSVRRPAGWRRALVLACAAIARRLHSGRSPRPSFTRRVV